MVLTTGRKLTKDSLSHGRCWTVVLALCNITMEGGIDLLLACWLSLFALRADVGEIIVKECV